MDCATFPLDYPLHVGLTTLAKSWQPRKEFVIQNKENEWFLVSKVASTDRPRSLMTCSGWRDSWSNNLFLTRTVLIPVVNVAQLAVATSVYRLVYGPWSVGWGLGLRLGLGLGLGLGLVLRECKLTPTVNLPHIYNWYQFEEEMWLRGETYESCQSRLTLFNMPTRATPTLF